MGRSIPMIEYPSHFLPVTALPPRFGNAILIFRFFCFFVKEREYERGNPELLSWSHLFPAGWGVIEPLGKYLLVGGGLFLLFIPFRIYIKAMFHCNLDCVIEYDLQKSDLRPRATPQNWKRYSNLETNEPEKLAVQRNIDQKSTTQFKKPLFTDLKEKTTVHQNEKVILQRPHPFPKAPKIFPLAPPTF